MIAHLVSFTCLEIILILDYATILALGTESRISEMTESQERLLFINTIITYFLSVGSLAVISTMLIMFHKHSLSLSESEKESITQRFMLVFSDGDQLLMINEERINLHSDQQELDKNAKKQQIYT